jgi:hypothetical protein
MAQQAELIRQNEASLAEATTSSALLAQTGAAERQRALVLAAELAAELGEQIVSPRQVLAGWEPLEQALAAVAKPAEVSVRLASRREQAEQRLAQDLLAAAPLNVAEAVAWQRDAAKAGAPLSREPLAGLKQQLAERVKTAEHRLYPQVLEDFCMGLARG